MSAPKKGKQPRQQFECPNCGASVVVGSKACRECGSDASTGWSDSDDIDYASVDLPDGYRDDGAHGPSDELPPAKTPTWVIVTAVVTALVMAAWITGAFALL
jgi:hypothetical protein